METLLKSTSTSTTSFANTQSKSSVISFWEKLESNRFGVIPILLVVIGCLGGLAASFGTDGGIVKLALVAFPTSIASALVIGLAPMKVVFYVSMLAILVDLICLIF